MMKQRRDSNWTIHRITGSKLLWIPIKVCLILQSCNPNMNRESRKLRFGKMPLEQKLDFKGSKINDPSYKYNLDEKKYFTSEILER